ncbi:hypothetical protein GQF00_15975 [Alcanivorax sp. DP30]|nr:hypothetical protein [Alcanivorax sp. DP30]
MQQVSRNTAVKRGGAIARLYALGCLFIVQ